MTTNLEKYQSTYPFAVNRIGHFYDELTRLIRMVKPRRILDIGCGEGFDVKNLSERNINPSYCCGLDLNRQALAMTKRLSLPFPCHVINADAYHLPLRLDQFDVILCLEILEHLSNPGVLLRQIAQRNDRYCVFSVPNEPLYRLIRLLVLRRNIAQLGNHPEHVNHWSCRSFARLLAQDFAVIETTTPIPWTIVLCRAPRTAG